MEICIEKRFSACNLHMLRSFNWKHQVLIQNRPHREESIYTLTVRIANAATVRSASRQIATQQYLEVHYILCSVDFHPFSEVADSRDNLSTKDKNPAPNVSEVPLYI